MSSNPNSPNNKWLVIFIIGGLVIYNTIDQAFFKPKRDAEYIKSIEEDKQKMIKLWTASTIDFFNNFNCSDLKYQPKDFLISKFISVDSYNANDCQISLNTDTSYDEYKAFNSIYTRNIDEANTLIWIIQKEGNQEGSYTGGQKAIRLVSEINFIEISTKTIFNKINIDYLGVAPENISRTNNSYSDELFGERNKEGEYLAIINEINRQRGLPPLN